MASWDEKAVEGETAGQGPELSGPADAEPVDGGEDDVIELGYD